METRHKGYGFTVKAVNEEEKSIVHVITDSTIDRSREIVDPNGADTKNFEKNPVVLFGHNYGGAWLTGSSPNIPVVGRSAWVKRDGESVISKTIFADVTEISRDAWALAKGGFLPATSIGFQPIGDIEVMSLSELKDLSPSNRGQFNGEDKVGIWRKWELLEYSLVPVPANPSALERSLLSKMLETSESEFVRGILSNSLNEKRLCELEECREKMEEAMGIERYEALLKRIEQLELKQEPEPGKVAKVLTGEELKSFIRQNVGGAFRQATGKLN